MEIAQFFGVKDDLTRLQTEDWDEVESQVKKIIKSSRAGAKADAPASAAVEG